MKNVYQIGLLGCASCCLVSAAQANPGVQESYLVFVDPVPVIYNVVCDAEPRSYTYTVQNIGDDPVHLTGAKTFYETEVPVDISINIGFPNTNPNDCFNSSPEPELFPGDTCELTLIVDPSHVEPEYCYPGNLPIFIDGEIELYANNQQREIESDFMFEISTFGVADYFALVGNNICTDDDEVCTDDPTIPRTLEGEILVWLNAAATNNALPHPNPPTDDISFVPDDVGYRMYTNPADAEVIDALLADINATIINFSNIVAAQCTPISADFFQSDWSDDEPEPGDPIPYNLGKIPGDLSNGIDPDVYCYNEEEIVYVDPLDHSQGFYPSNPPFVVDLDLNFAVDSDSNDNSESDVFIFFLESEDFYTLAINPGATFTLGDVAPYNIYWIVAGAEEDSEMGGNVEVYPSSAIQFAGNLLVTGYFESDIAGSLPQVTGRIFALKDVIVESGLTIECPYPSDSHLCTGIETTNAMK